MKAILATVVLFLVGISAWADDRYVLLGSSSSVKTPDGVTLKLRAGDWLPYARRSDSGAWVSYRVAGMEGGVPWHEATLAIATPKIRAAYKGVVDRLADDYTAALSKREAARERAVIQARVRVEQDAAAREYRQSQRLLWELQNIGDQLEIMNRRRR